MTLPTREQVAALRARAVCLYCYCDSANRKNAHTVQCPIPGLLTAADQLLDLTEAAERVVSGQRYCWKFCMGQKHHPCCTMSPDLAALESLLTRGRMEQEKKT